MFVTELIIGVSMLAMLLLPIVYMHKAVKSLISKINYGVVNHVLTALITILWALLLASFLFDNESLRLGLNGWLGIGVVYLFMGFKFTHTHYGHHLYAKVTNLHNKPNKFLNCLNVESIHDGVCRTSAGEYFGVKNGNLEMEIYRHLTSDGVVHVVTIPHVVEVTTNEKI